MIADFFTKPLQGSLFRKMRGIIMGTLKLPIEERVENTFDIKNTVSNMAIGQFKHTNDNTTKLVGTKEKQVNASKKNARGFKRVKRVIPVEVRNE